MAAPVPLTIWYEGRAQRGRGYFERRAYLDKKLRFQSYIDAADDEYFLKPVALAFEDEHVTWTRGVDEQSAAALEAMQRLRGKPAPICRKCGDPMRSARSNGAPAWACLPCSSIVLEQSPAKQPEPVIDVQFVIGDA